MPYNVISSSYIAKFKINSNTEIEVFYKDKKFVSVSEVYKVQYNSNGIIRQLIGNDIKLKYKCNSMYYYYSDDSILDIDSFDVLKDGIIVDDDEDDEDDEEDDDDEDDEEDDDEEIKPKRISGYILFCNSIRDDVMSKWQQFVEEGGAKPKIQYIMAESAQKWKALSEDERTVWNDKAKAKSNLPTSHNRNHENEEEEEDEEDTEDYNSDSTEVAYLSDEENPHCKRTTGFLVFASENKKDKTDRTIMFLGSPSSKVDLDLMTQLGERWKDLSEEEHTNYAKKAELINNHYAE